MRKNDAPDAAAHLAVHSMIERLSKDFELGRELKPELRESLLAGESVYDHELDVVLPPRYRALSELHWSPLEVARKIAELLKPTPKARFIDIGSGCGKLCLLLAMLTDLEISGIEQREDLHRVAVDLCEANIPGRVRLIHGNMLSLDWSKYDVFYLYNPFHEHFFGKLGEILPIDRAIPLSRRSFAQYVDEVFRQLVLLRPGQRVITFHGYGGKMPPSMKFIESHKIENGTLQLWEKSATAAP